MRTSFMAAAAVAAMTTVQAALIEHWWDITYAEANPDQMYERRVIGVNGTWPPPPVVATRGDIVRIHATNKISQPAALHAHGMFFNRTGYYDGPVGVTQCGIPVDASLTYDIDTQYQQGTYWIHGHNLGQYTDGLRTPFIIHPNKETTRTDITWDHDFTAVVSEWYHEEHEQLLTEFMSIYNPTGAEPVPPSALIYFAENFANYSDYVGGAAAISNGSITADRSMINFEAGKKYLIRFINMGAFAMFQLALDGHEWQIVEVDGVETNPYTIDHFPISVAQRYAVLVTAKNDTSENFHLHANFDPQMFDTVPDDLQLNYTATINYKTGNSVAEGSTIEAYDFFDDTVMSPHKPVAMAEADYSFALSFAFDTFDNGINRAAFNETTYNAPSTPSLFTAASMGAKATVEAYGAMTNAHIFQRNQMIQLTIINTDSGQHPFHLHGHNFQVVHRSFNDSSPALVEGQPNPFVRDVVMVPPDGGSTTIRFRADNPGVWFFHCHIDWHLSSGLAAVFITAPEVIQSTFTIPQEMKDHCAALGIHADGNVVGTYSTTDFTGEPLGPYPIVAGWTTKARGAMAGCVLAAVLGMASVVWYSWGSLDEAEIEAEEQRRHDQKMLDKAEGRKHGVLGLANKLAGRQ
ncbi:Multicopper oxidases [Phaffia rhodozyma]|uniref:Multicopper oxidases n=1 Tax=Phaffia rhodozyma TaxID=264483 RepID=A0A0F7SU45_PHARH|nr:Multicopper oxidases [Phaffia rhodozyma]